MIVFYYNNVKTMNIEITAIHLITSYCWKAKAGQTVNIVPTPQNQPTFELFEEPAGKHLRLARTSNTTPQLTGGAVTALQRLQSLPGL